MRFVNGLSHTKKNNYPRGQTGKPSDLGSEDFVSSTLTVGTDGVKGLNDGLVLLLETPVQQLSK